jgi:ABC-type amino acid transport substrate-binding protein
VVVFALAGWACGFSSAAPPPPNRYDPWPPADTRVLRLGVKYDVPQFGYYDRQKKTWTGFDVDLATFVAKKLNKEPVLVPTATRDRISLLTGRNPYGRPCVDVVFSTFTKTVEREAQGVMFSDAYWVDHQVFLTKRGRSVPIISGTPAVCATTGSTSVEQVRQLLPHVKIRTEANHEKCYKALERNEVVAVTSGEIILLGFLLRNPDHLQFSGKPFSTEPYAAGIWNQRPDRHELTASINKVIEETKRNGRWRELCRRWVGSLMERPCKPPRADVTIALKPQS